MNRLSSVSFALILALWILFFFSSRRRHTRFKCDWSSDVCSSDLRQLEASRPRVYPAFTHADICIFIRAAKTSVDMADSEWVGALIYPIRLDLEILGT